MKDIRTYTKAECVNFCSDCGRCHDNRWIKWGEIAPPCMIGESQPEDFEVSCAMYGHSDDDGPVQIFIDGPNYGAIHM